MTWRQKSHYRHLQRWGELCPNRGEQPHGVDLSVLPTREGRGPSSGLQVHTFPENSGQTAQHQCVNKQNFPPSFSMFPSLLGQNIREGTAGGHTGHP